MINLGWLKKKYEQAKHEVKGELKHRSEVRRVQKQTYRAEQVKEAARFGKQKAKFETDQRIKQMRQPKPAYTFGGFAGPTTKQPTPSLGIGAMLTSSSPRGSKTSRNELSSMLGGGSRQKKSVSQSLRGFGL